MSTGKVRKHATAGGKAAKIFLTNDRLQGKTIDDTIVADTPAFCWHAVNGDLINCLLAANAVAVVIGDWVESAGDGTVRKFVGLTDNSGGTANTTLADVEGTYTEATLANNFADLAAYINATKGNSIGYANEAVDNSAVAAVARLAVRIA
jgi:hypothetical protein